MTEPKPLDAELLRIDAEKTCRDLASFIQKQVADSNREGIAVAISGGLDSSVTAALCVLAVGNRRVHGLMLPERLGNPEADRYGSLLACHLEIAVKKSNISPILKGLGTMDYVLSATAGRRFWKGAVERHLAKRGQSTRSEYFDWLRGTLDSESRSLIAKVSSRQRARVLAAYKYAEENNLLLAGSAHRTEHLTGLFVKYGIDDSADLMPLLNLYRSQILAQGTHLSLPAKILERAPNPDILPGVTDKYQSYFGLDALQVDLVLIGLEQKRSVPDIAEALRIPEEAVSTVEEAVRLSAFLRNHAAAPATHTNPID